AMAPATKKNTNASPTLLKCIVPSPFSELSVCRLRGRHASPHAELVGQSGTDRVIRWLHRDARRHILRIELAEAIFQPRRPAPGDHGLDAGTDGEAVEGGVVRQERRVAAQQCTHC